jgi:hypothetical protein
MPNTRTESEEALQIGSFAYVIGLLDANQEADPLARPNAVPGAGSESGFRSGVLLVAEETAAGESVGSTGKEASTRGWAGRPVLVQSGRLGPDHRHARLRAKAGAVVSARGADRCRMLDPRRVS